MKNQKKRLTINRYTPTEICYDSRFITDISIFYCLEGRATINLNGAFYIFKKATNFIVVETTHFAFQELSEDFCYIEITFGEKSFNRIYTHIDTTILNKLKSSTPDVTSPLGFVFTNLTLDKIILLNKSDSKHRDLIMRNLIVCYIFECYDLLQEKVKRPTDSNSNVVSNLVSRFLILCREQHKDHREIDYYADSLAISRRYLHTIVKAKLHATPKQIIDGFVLSSAKKMLLTTTKNNYQIADDLNFPDQSSFGQYIRRISGVSPSELRKQMKKES